MKVGFNNIEPDSADVLVVPVFSECEKIKFEKIQGIYSHVMSRGIFKGECGEIFSIILSEENKFKDVVLLGLGKKEELTSEKIRSAFAKAVKKCEELKAQKIFTDFAAGENMMFETVDAVIEGLRFGSYRFDKYISDKKCMPEMEICIGSIGEEHFIEAHEYAAEANILADAVITAKNLVNEPAEVLFPETLADFAVNYGKECGFQVEVLDKKAIEGLCMKAFLAVAKGSSKEPRFIIMRYFGEEENRSKILGLVGKGLTYDSGGYNIKPGTGMVNMKDDMGGAAAVIGAIGAIAKRKLKINVVAVVAACENMISGAAYKPGDIIGSMAGKTIEIVSTDAEGRLTLADAVHYIISKENASRIIDIATLTGAVVSALGNTTTGVITNNESFYKELEDASKMSGENMWLYPSSGEYRKLNKSHIADLKNSSGRQAATIAAGIFIGEFVQDKPWLHLDVAGTAFAGEDRDYYNKGGTGIGVRTIYHLAKAYSSR